MWNISLWEIHLGNLGDEGYSLSQGPRPTLREATAEWQNFMKSLFWFFPVNFVTKSKFNKTVYIITATCIIQCVCIYVCITTQYIHIISIYPYIYISNAATGYVHIDLELKSWKTYLGPEPSPFQPYNLYITPQYIHISKYGVHCKVCTHWPRTLPPSNPGRHTWDLNPLPSICI